ncbi:WD40 repeat-like protein [Dothidotthia symphoricarpi CBS 119687]|uniref:WD40 repeat-like protein n=1 Tax=Dothidotthia symphoricarpi CBS 119687 TaxID=1392245 RepID=A0A6A6A3B1_9PLEO|nr:WD40 repeat-like protein [Dothidotthia symphoricarpi CBS 119687]KAF2125397.1 WD40 repeat-like protein [Dothidotthia symphoricarpi CBS 119687]
MVSLTPAFSSNAGLAPNSYIYKILSTAARQDPLTYSQTDQLAIISSDDSLRFLDPTTLSILPDGLVKNVNQKVTCLERANDLPSNIVATAGRDGLVRFWDKRSKQKVLEIESPHKLISSLVCDAERNFIAAGIENPDDGAGVSPVYIWDQRNPSIPTLSLIESHTDTITSLALHPTLPNLLLSSSTDGLVNIFDITQPEEEDALYQVINHGSAIAHAGFMYPSTDIFALGTDETMSFYALQSQKEEEEEPTPKTFGDVREALGCEYLAKMHWIGSEAFVATGKHSESRLDLVPVRKNSSAPLDYQYNLDQSTRFPGAHGEEIVRDLYTDVHTQITYTCGEDGHIRAWKSSDTDSMDIDASAESSKKSKDRKEKRKDKKEKRKGDEKKIRYNPY